VIKVLSIDIDNADRDGHLRSNEFLSMGELPEITFTSTAAEKTGDEDFRLSGNLSVKGVTNSVIFDFEYQGSAKDPHGNLRAGFEGEAILNRKDFGVTTNLALETGGVLVGNKITLELDVSLIRLRASDGERVNSSDGRTGTVVRGRADGAEIPEPAEHADVRRTGCAGVGRLHGRTGRIRHRRSLTKRRS
jgi:hypothetical protein